MLDTGDWHAGLIFTIDGSDVIPAVLSFEAGRGVRLDVSFAPHGTDSRFEVARQWFREQNVPETLVFSSDEHRLTLFGVRWGGHRDNGNVALGYLYVDDAVVGLQTDGTLDALLTVELQSHIDSLYEWTGFRAASYENITDEEGFVQRVEASVETVEELSWRQGDATMWLTTNWRGDNSRPGLHIDEWTLLRSTFDEARPVADHLEQQTKVRLLLSILYGTEISFRRLDVRDERFYPRHSDGRVYSRSGQQLFTARTYRESARPAPDEETLRKGVAKLPQIGQQGLELWGERFDEWQRVIFPAAAILSRGQALLEDRVVSLSMSLEAAGKLLPPLDEEKVTYRGGTIPTMATYVYRCLASLDVDWTAVADSKIGLARAVALNYNNIKHYNKRHGSEFPDGDHTFLVSQAAAVVVRLLIANLIVPDGSLAQNWQPVVGDAFGWFEAHALRVNDDGEFVTQA